MFSSSRSRIIGVHLSGLPPNVYKYTNADQQKGLEFGVYFVSTFRSGEKS